jgi:LPS-assembly protein
MIETLMRKSQPNTAMVHLFLNSRAPALTQIVGLVCICCFFFASSLMAKPRADMVRVQADQVLIQPKGKPSQLTGHVRVTHAGQLIQADRAQLQRHAQTGKIARVDVAGHIVAHLPGKMIKAQQGYVDINGRRSVFLGLFYALLEPTAHTTMTAWGRAAQAEISPEGVFSLQQATYTTCPLPARGQPSWYLSAQRVELRTKQGFGQAFHSILYVGGVPVFYLPYLPFPLSHQRMSGFLLPTIGHSNRDGWHIRLPFYWNIAPNRDITLTPEYRAHRGMLLSVVARYLTRHSQGQISLYGLAHDRLFKQFQSTASSVFTDPLDAPGLSQLLRDHTHRLLLAINHHSQWNSGWQWHAYVNLASDDYVFLDVGNPFHLIDSTHLLNQARLDYTGRYQHVTAQIQGYQTLHPLTQPMVSDLYTRLPELRWQARLPQNRWGAAGQLDARFIYFDHRRDFLTGLPWVTGRRFDLYPTLGLPWRTRGGFLTPKIGVRLTDYHLQHRLVGERTHIDRLLPIASIDAGLFFDRILHWGKGYRQTLEPRAFYLFIPQTDQTDIPLFDTTLAPVNFAQLFRENRFIGSDRIGDANQLSLGVTSRFLSTQTGREKLRLSLGAAFYFHPHQVCLQPDCIHDPSQGHHMSPLVAESSYHFNKALTGGAALAWNLETGQANNAYLELRYLSGQKHLFYLGYDYLRDNNITLTDLSYAGTNRLQRVYIGLKWPIIRHWSVLGYWHYNIDSNTTESYYYGLSYEKCCWALQWLGTGKLQGITTHGRHLFDKRFYIQFQLKGFTNIGNGNPFRLLHQQMER